MPASLHNEQDWALFQAALDRAALILIGRASHVATPNTKGRARLVISSQVRGLAPRPGGIWLNPADMPLGEALRRVLPEGGEVAVVGGQGAFDLVGAAGFAAFHLSRARRVRMPEGRGLFRACEAGVPAAAVLAAGGLVAAPEILLDPDADVTLTVWSAPDDALERI
jgi:hypothetical protein